MDNRYRPLFLVSLRNQRQNPIKALIWYNKNREKWFNLSIKKRNEFKRGIFVFYSISFWALLFILSFFNQIFFCILIGVIFHMAADLPHLKYHNEPVLNKIFLNSVIRRNKNKKSLREL